MEADGEAGAPSAAAATGAAPSSNAQQQQQQQQQQHRDRVKQHYDAHVKAGQTTEQALLARRKGAAAPLKVFHNDIKRRLILR
jgi:hypothetical protein